MPLNKLLSSLFVLDYHGEVVLHARVPGIDMGAVSRFHEELESIDFFEVQVWRDDGLLHQVCEHFLTSLELDNHFLVEVGGHGREISLGSLGKDMTMAYSPIFANSIDFFQGYAVVLLVDDVMKHVLACIEGQFEDPWLARTRLDLKKDCQCLKVVDV